MNDKPKKTTDDEDDEEVLIDDDAEIDLDDEDVEPGDRRRDPLRKP